MAAAHRRPPSSSAAAAGSTSCAPAVISSSGDGSSSRSPASATRRTPIEALVGGEPAQQRRRRHVAGRRADDDRIRAQLDRQPQRLEGVLGHAVTAASPMPARITSARPGTRSTITTVGTRGVSGMPASSASSCERTNSVRCAAAACWVSVAAMRSPSGGRSGSATVNSAPPSGASLERDLAAVQLDELAHDRQPEAGPRAAARPSPSSPERKRPNTLSRCSGGHARARVGDAQRGGAVPRRQRAAHLPADRRVPDRVGEQVRHDPADPLHVEARGDRVRRVDQQVDLTVLSQRDELLRDGAHGICAGSRRRASGALRHGRP